MSIEDFINNVKTNPMQTALGALHDVAKEDMDELERLRGKEDFSADDVESISILLEKYRSQIPDDLYDAVNEFSTTTVPPDIIAPIDPEEGIYAKMYSGKCMSHGENQGREHEIFLCIFRRWGIRPGDAC